MVRETVLARGDGADQPVMQVLGCRIGGRRFGRGLLALLRQISLVGKACTSRSLGLAAAEQAEGIGDKVVETVEKAFIALSACGAGTAAAWLARSV